MYTECTELSMYFYWDNIPVTNVMWAIDHLSSAMGQRWLLEFLKDSKSSPIEAVLDQPWTCNLFEYLIEHWSNIGKIGLVAPKKF